MNKKNIKFTKQEFIKRSKEVHGNKFDYSLVEYINMNTKVILICPIHGEFSIYPNNHIYKKCGCWKCEKTYKLTKDEFINRSNKIHEYKYDYSLVDYKNNRTKVKIICPKHGTFEKTPNKHLNSKQGCPKCSPNSKGENIIKYYLDKNNIQYEVQHRFDECKNINSLPFDFFIKEMNLCIEYDGIQHFDKNSKFYFNDLIKNDKIKNKYCKMNNIELLRIKYNEDIYEKLKENLNIF